MVPKTGLLAGRTINGGLIFAGVDGAPTSRAIRRRSRSRRAAASATRSTRRRSCAAATACSTRRGTTARRSTARSASPRTTSLTQSDATTGVPITSLENPFPGGLMQPIGSSLGLLTGTGGTIDFVDQNKGDPEGSPVLVRRPARAAGQHGGHRRLHRRHRARPRLLRHRRRRQRRSDQHQPDRSGGRARGVPGAERDLERGGAARHRCPTRSSAFRAPASSARAPTIQAGQLLRPFPQFGDVYAFEVTEGGRRQYHAATFVLDKRTTGWWGGRFSYTLSQTEGQPVRAGQHLPDAHGHAAEQLRPGCRVRRQQLRLAAPDHPGADRQVPRLEQQQRRGQVAAQRLERLGGRRAGQRLAAERRAQRRASRLQPGPPRRPAAAQSHRRSEHRRAATTIAWSTAGNDDARYFDGARLRESRAPDSTATRRAPIGDARYQFRKNIDLVLAKDTTLFGTHVGADPLRDPEPDRTRRSSAASTRTPSTRRPSAASRSRPGSCGSGS